MFFGRLVSSHGNLANKLKTLRGYFYGDVKNTTFSFLVLRLCNSIFILSVIPVSFRKNVNKQIEIVTFLLNWIWKFSQTSKSGFKSFNKRYKAEDHRSFGNVTFICLCCFILCTRCLEVTLLSYAEHVLQIVTVLPKCSFKRHLVGFKQGCFCKNVGQLNSIFFYFLSEIQGKNKSVTQQVDLKTVLFLW